MTETIRTAMDRLMTTAAEPQDYVAEDGLLYCGSCNTPKEAFFPNGRKLFGHDRHPAECLCRQAVREKQEAEEKARLHRENVRRLKLQGFTDWAMQHWTFENDHGQNPQMHLAQRYVDHWPEMREKNVGLLLWGGVGTGKSYMAGCIANALMEQEIAVCMTNFARIMNELNSTFAGRNEVVDRLCSYPLLVIDQELHQRLEEHKNLKKLIQKNSGKSVLETKKVALNRKIEQLSGNIVRLESQKRSGYEQYVLGKPSKEKFLELKQGMENEIVELKREKATKEKERTVVQEELRQKKQITDGTEILLTADNLQQYVKKIEVDCRKITYTEFLL